MQAWQEEVERARQGQRDAERKLSSMEASFNAFFLSPFLGLQAVFHEEGIYVFLDGIQKFKYSRIYYVMPIFQK